MPNKPSAFDRDKARLLGLLRETLQRVREERSRTSIGNIAGLLREIDETEVAVKLGFSGPPIMMHSPWMPQYKRTLGLIWNDPFGNPGGQFLVSAVMQVGNQEVDSYENRDKVADRELLAAVLELWIRAVEAKVEPDAYPALPPHLAPGVPRHLWADPLWRRLFFLIASFEKGPLHYWEKEHHLAFSRETAKINRLAAESGLAGSVPFRFGGPRVAVHGPNGEHVVDLRRAGEGIKEPDGPTKDKVVACLRAWQDARVAQFGERGSEVTLAPPEDSSDRIARRLSGERLRVVKCVYEALSQDAREWIPATELDRIGLPSKTVFAHSRKQMVKDRDYRGSASLEYRRASLLHFVADVWSPRGPTRSS